MAPEILDLNTLAPERPLARIRWAELDAGEKVERDETFELLVPDQIGTLELSRITRLYVDHDELWEKAKRTATEDKRLERLANDLTQALVPDAPATAIAALSAIAKRSLAVRFFVGAGLATQATLGSELTELMSRQTSSSPGSPDSTGAEPATGSSSPDPSSKPAGE